LVGRLGTAVREPEFESLLEDGRDSFAGSSWSNAFESFSAAAQVGELAPEDLELLSTSAYMLGRVTEMLEYLEQAHHAYLNRGSTRQAVKAAIWLGSNLASRGKMGPASGWIGRAQRLLDADDEDCVERGYLLLPQMFQHEARGNLDAVITTAHDAARIGTRFGDADLVALARHTEGRALVKLGQAGEGLALLDEVMLSVTGDELSPEVTGIVYCSVLEGCYEVHEIRRAREWTAALSQWCDEQPDLVAFTGRCLAHRAEIMQLEGKWNNALEEARRAGSRHARGFVAAQAFYQQAEVHRLRGEYKKADAAYRSVSESGGDPHPGLARLRLAEGNADAGVAAIRRAEAEGTSILDRARLLPAFIDIMLVIGDVEGAQAAALELERLSERTEVDLHAATAAYGLGAVDMAHDDAASALASLRKALGTWQDLAVPYEEGRTRVLIGNALSELSDLDTATLEFAAARSIFAELGAEPDVQRVDRLTSEDDRKEDHGLSSRELEVLLLLTSGGTNRAIAAELVLSERTVDRHLSNIFTKLGVSSRTAATAYAYEHGLV
jgi:DNA-binding CsgD family transcriptional regulator